MSKRNVDPDYLRLTDIMTAIHDVESIALRETSDRRDMLACAYAVAIIGEASSQLSKALRDKHPYIPWQGIIGMRHRIIHGYGNLDKQRLLAVVQVDIPPLKASIEKIISQQKSST